MTVPTLEERQKVLKELAFHVLDDLERANIRCAGVFGTALGAARHGDMVPWDDDIDFAVLREDLPSALEVLRADPELFVWDWLSDPMDPTPLPKVLWRISPDDPPARRAANVDVFVLEPQPVGAFPRRLMACLLLMVRLAILWKLPTEAVRRAARARYAPVRWVARALCAPFKAATLKRFYEKVVAAAGRRTTGELWIPSDSPVFAILRTFRRVDFEQPARLPFGDRELPVPKDVAGYLTTVYGNWRKLPPEEKRQPHAWGEDGKPHVMLPPDEARFRK